jgi:conjugal transfer pilus assembly protein TraW
MRSQLSSFLLISALVFGLARASNPILGQTFPIAEPDTLSEIEERAAKVDWNALRERAGAHSQAFLSARLPIAEHDSSRLFDPTYTLPQDISDSGGKVLFRKGTRVNVYQRIHDPARYIVIADDPAQIRWLTDVVKPGEQDVVLLANGNVYEARERTQLDLYLLDERFIERFGLQHVPSIVHQEGTMLRVEEFAVR